MFVFPTTVECIRLFLGQGQRKEAADIAMANLENLDAAELRQIVGMFAPEVRARGDERRRGAPKLDEKPGWMGRLARRSLALREFRGCVLARRIVDKEVLSAEELASALWLIDMRLIPEGVEPDLELPERHEAVARVFAVDLESARQAIAPHAENLLREHGLMPGRRNPRKGYVSATREKIATRYNISARLLRELAG